VLHELRTAAVWAARRGPRGKPRIWGYANDAGAVGRRDWCTTLGWRRASPSPTHSTSISRSLPLPHLHRRRKWRRFQFRAAVASSWRTRMYDVRSAGQVECRWREEAFACHWHRTVNTGARGGGNRCGWGRAWVPSVGMYWDSWVVPARCTFMGSSKSFIRHFSSVVINTSVIYTMTTPAHPKALQKLSASLQNREQHWTIHHTCSKSGDANRRADVSEIT